MRGITRDTVSEMLDRKAFLISVVAASAATLGVLTNDLGTVHIDFGNIMADESAAFPNAMRTGMHFLAIYLDLLLALTVLFVAGVLPSFLEPKFGWFYFGRPMDRQKIIIEKLVSLVVVYTALLLAAVLPATLVGMIRYGIVDIRIAEIIAVQGCAAVIWILIASSLGVLFRSSVKVVPLCLGLVAIQVIINSRETLARSLDSPAVAGVLKAISYAIPRTNDFSQAAHQLADGQTLALWWPIGSSLLFALVLVYSALLAVKRRDL